MMEKMTIEELYNEAIMMDQAIVIVEGRDDIKFYTKLSYDMGKQIEVIAVENISGYNAGCQGVIKLIESIQDEIKKHQDGEKYILGIIDRDARFYRNEIPKLKCLFILKYYSFESHLANSKCLSKIIPKLCDITPNMIDDKLIGFLEKDLSDRFNELFYISLEALKNACEDEYESLFSYNQEAGRVFGKDNLNMYLPKLELKKKELDEFAENYKIELSDLKKIAKGKWYIHIYSQSVFNNMKELTQQCKQNHIHQCQYCKNGIYDKCMYKLNTKFQRDHLKCLLLQEYDEDEVGYIKDRINLLA